ncbi:MAG: GNAT family N-acetyltransferase [Candidatus Eiseniibacteriota bacterium]
MNEPAKAPAKAPPLTVRPISVAEAQPIRKAILRPHLPPEQCVYPGDDLPDSLHVGAFDGDRLVGVATVLHQPPDGSSDPYDWRIRGVATLPEVRRRGAGSGMMRRLEAHARAHGARRVWFNARTDARAFYEALGYAVDGAPFDVPGVGMHLLMWKDLEETEGGSATREPDPTDGLNS